MNQLSIEKIISRRAKHPSSAGSTQDSPATIYILSGPPIPLARHRHAHGRTWNPQKEALVCARITLEQQHNNLPFFCGPVQLNATFYMPIPSSHSTKKKNRLFGTFHHIKPDLSNLLKFIEDAATGVLYKDDSVIASTTVEKIYSYEPRTELTIMELP